jgi:mono/diheme cytochrome c family protein
MKSATAIVALALMATGVASGFSRLDAGSGFSAKILLNQTATSSSTQKADAARGKMLFDKTLRCYACHGFGGQTGTPRLVPMARSEEAFISYLRKPATPAMPAFADVPRQDLVDVYAYIKSIPTDAPSSDSIPLLNDLIQRSTTR